MMTLSLIQNGPEVNVKLGDSQICKVSTFGNTGVDYLKHIIADARERDFIIQAELSRSVIMALGERFYTVTAEIDGSEYELFRSVNSAHAHELFEGISANLKPVMWKHTFGTRERFGC